MYALFQDKNRIEEAGQYAFLEGCFLVDIFSIQLAYISSEIGHY